jgi:hypothetical protein
LISTAIPVQHASMTAELEDHYGVDLIEDTRLTRSPHGRLEYLRTQELIRRWLPRPGASVLDVGGGTGVHAAWLASDGHTAHVVDPVPFVGGAHDLADLGVEVQERNELRPERVAPAWVIRYRGVPSRVVCPRT